MEKCTQWLTALALITRCKSSLIILQYAQTSLSPCQCRSLTMRTALSMSQSLKIMRGDFPPSSRDTFFRLLTAQLQQGGTKGMKFHLTVTSTDEQLAELVWSYLFMICLPIGVEPVKPSLRMSGWSDKRCPTMPPAAKNGIGKVGYGSMTKGKV